jgi:UDP-N-acetylglucosamine--N-acetylmuramyl-(pentapeptide) pyrophosphoryl-undecaprenol N-acetylglucosamine transferase
MSLNRVIISGGGTGGHIFPAIAVADEIKRRNPMAEILFVGAIGKMEMEKVPAAGYPIEGLTIAGFQRKLTLSNFMLPLKLFMSLLKARRILKNFKPQVVIGVGGYASGPTLQMATMLRIPTLVQEQNSFPGKTNKLLAKKVNAICTAYDGLENFFPKEKIVLTGNPVRKEMVDIKGKRNDAFAFYGLDPTIPTILFIGGSLGARTLNKAVLHHLELCQRENIQLLWQCGKLYAEALEEELKNKNLKGVKMVRFVDRMDYAYALADAIVSRAGAISVSELCLVGKPVILVPSPNVAEDHQTKNAMALVEKNAALLVKDKDALENLLPTAIELIRDENKRRELGENIQRLGKPHATSDIVDIIEKIAQEIA